MRQGLVRRLAHPSRSGRTGLLLAGAATAGAAISLIGPWFWVLGLLVTVAGGVAVALVATRELRIATSGLLAQQDADARLAADRLSGERRQHVRLLRVLQGRFDELRQEAQGLVGDNEKLRAEVAHLTAAADALRLEPAEADGELLALPRRGTSGADWDWPAEDRYAEFRALANPPSKASRRLA